MKGNILIAGYPYVRESYRNTFLHYPGPEKVFFLLPKRWKVKGGRVIFKPSPSQNVFTTATFFHHSLYPVLGGLFKGWMPFYPIFLARHRKALGIRLVYAASEPALLATLYFGFWTKVFGLRFLIFTWENVPYEQKFHSLKLWFKRSLVAVNLSLSDGVVCGNQKAAGIISHFTKKPHPVIPMSGVDSKLFTKSNGQTTKSFRGCDFNDKIVFTFAGSISYRKGIHLAVRAFKLLHSDFPNARLAIAGSGEYEIQIARLAEEVGLNDCVIRIPWLSPAELKALLSISDVFLYPSLSYGGWEEQMGYSMMEASLAQLPVISTRSGSIEEVVIDGQTGILVEPDNISALQQAMFALAKDVELRRRLGRRGREYIAENFRHEIVAKKYQAVFSEFLKY